MKLQGIYVPVITPFDHEEKINFRALSSLIELQINAGVSGIIASGTTGESYALSQQITTPIQRSAVLAGLLFKLHEN